jgi:hypothetical protein
MLYLAVASPLLVLGFLLVMQRFETWVLGDNDDDVPGDRWRAVR